FLHSRRNFRRSLPFNALASACFEHSSETALRCFFSAATSAGAFVSVFVASLDAGAGVCAKVVPINRKAATAVAVASEQILVMGHITKGREKQVGGDHEPRMNNAHDRRHNIFAAQTGLALSQAAVALGYWS